MKLWTWVKRGSTVSLLALTFAQGGGAAAETAPRSGRYGSLVLAVRGSSVSGVFADVCGGINGMPSFSCIFLLRGTLSGPRAALETWYPGEAERIAGTLTFTAEGAELRLVEDHGGCSMTTGGMVDKPYTLPREVQEGEARPENWRGVGLVTARRAALRTELGQAPRRTPYLVADDAVVVLERREGWVRALYQGGKAPVVGWLPATDLAVEEP
ncbi:hypothetical protein [Methylobacterium sp. XJLW]|uniref:hypothetical protein n=2 Tax=Methylobacterium TaxID=407 RepID=UPI0005C16D40|nr:hypothetical protein [Methylobacterium sp. XJLW]